MENESTQVLGKNKKDYSRCENEANIIQFIVSS